MLEQITMLAATMLEFFSQYVAIMFQIKNVRTEYPYNELLFEDFFLKRLSSIISKGTSAIEAMSPEKLSYHGKASKIPLRIAKIGRVDFFILFFVY